MTNSIAKDFRFFSLLHFAFPTMIMMVFMSLYTIIDGIFVSRLVGTDALSAINIVYPVLNLVIAVGVMLATGGSAIIAKKLGEDLPQEARENFSFLIFVGLFFGIISMILGNLLIEPLVRLLSATDLILQCCIDYLSICLFMAPACILQLLFQSFFVTAGKPVTGLALTISGGIANMVLDYVFIGTPPDGHQRSRTGYRNWPVDPSSVWAALLRVCTPFPLSCKTSTQLFRTFGKLFEWFF